MVNKSNINPLSSPGEVVAVFTYPYLSVGAQLEDFFKTQKFF